MTPTILKDQFNKPRTKNTPAFVNSRLSLLIPKDNTGSEKKKIKSIRSGLEPLFLGSYSNRHTCYKCTYPGALDWIIPSHYQSKYINHAHEPLLKDFFEVADQGSHGVILWHSRDLYLANLLSPDRFIISASCRCLLWSEGCHLGLTARLIWQLHPKHLLGLQFPLILQARDDPPSSFSLSF